MWEDSLVRSAAPSNEVRIKTAEQPVFQKREGGTRTKCSPMYHWTEKTDNAIISGQEKVAFREEKICLIILKRHR